ncbi:hypothetical protein GOV05_05200, partial [Candidatus Woesearchaeota archaeon]|nr:hypothetical protein [Candidatus Woesearchaeota archaeon]
MKEKRKDQYSLIKIALAIALFLVLSSFVLGYTPLYRGIYNDSYGMPAGHFETTPFPIDENTTTYTIINDEGNHTYYLGTKYYVATNGTDSGGCTNFYDPCLTINYAITQAGSGNKAIIIRNGTYEETSLTLQSGDNDTNRFIITGYGQERPIINGSSTTQDTINAGSNTQYATIQRVKIQDNYRNGIRTGSDDSYINTVDVWLYHNDKWDDSINSTRGDANLYYLGTDNTWIYHTTSEHTDGHGFKVGDDADNAIVEWSIAREAGYWEDYHLTERLSGHPTACDFPNDPGVYGENITIRYTVCGTSLFYAVQLRRLTNFSFHHNEVYDGIHYANVSGTSGRGVGAHQIIINEDSTYGEFHSNIIRSSGPAQNGTGTNAIYVMATNNGAGPINIYNNLIYDNNGAAFRVNNAITNSTINFFSNTVFSNDTGNYDEKANSTIVTQSNVTLTNNIFYQAANKKIIEECLWVGGCSLNHTYNLYYAPSGSVGITLDSTEINADPEWLMIPSGNYTEGFAKLNSTSPAIDNGTDLNVYFNTDFDGLTRPQGSAWDIGAYEYDFPPSIINVSDNLTHGLNISIIGLDFGSKNPAAPLIWDDGENASVDLDNLLTSTSAVKNNGGVGWDYIKPSTESALSSPFPTHARIRYRDIPYRNTPAPHEYSTKYISGAHYQYENNTPAYIGAGENFRDVLVTVDNGAAAPRWYASFYYRLDPLWPDNSPGSLNHKTSVINGGPQAYYGTGYSYLDYRASESPSWSNSSTRFGNMQGNGICDIGTYPGDFAQVNNPRLDWIKYEEVISDDYWGYRGLFIDNVIATQTQTNCPYWFSSQSGDFSNGIQSYTAGGYWRWSINSTFETSSFRGNNNSFRYFDDLYVDTTLSRVVLANNQNYSQATIVEPQIPYAWQNNNINVTVNLGRINTTTAYLYVFDKDDHHNEIGYPVTIIQEETPWCTNTSTVICANSCSYADVSSAVSSASDGDTVMVPGGSCTWSSTLSIPSNKGITLMGAGVDQTNISGSANPRITLNTQLGTRPTSISGFDFRSGGDAVHVYGTGQNWRIHNNKFWAGAFDVNGLTYGVIDNNLFVGDTVQQNGVWGEISGDGGAVDWTVPLALGSQKAVYIENNVFNYTNMNTGTSICDGRGGGRWVIRNNTIFNAPWGSHDAYTNGKRGILSFEFYGNDWSSNSSVGVWTTNYHRGGTGTIFDNTFRARAWNSGSPIYFNDIVTRDSGGAQTPWDADCDNIDELICSDGAGTIYPLSCTINANCVGYGGLCDTVIDGNEDGTGYPCRDQFGTTTDGTGEIVKHPVIVWNNQQCTNNTSPYTNCVPSTTALVGFPGSDANWVKEERDYVDDTSCNDSVDNDGDGDTDMNDTVCQEYWDFTNNKKLGYAAFDYPHPLITGIPGVSLLDPMWNHTTNETIINLTCSVIDNGNLS